MGEILLIQYGGGFQTKVATCYPQCINKLIATCLPKCRRVNTSYHLRRHFGAQVLIS